MKLVRLSALGTGRIYWYSVVLQTESPRAHSAAGRMSMRNRNDPLSNRERVLPACSPAPQPKAPPRTPICV